MPQESDALLRELLLEGWQLRRVGRTAWNTALANQPHRNFGTLERIRHAIRHLGMDGAVPVSTLIQCSGMAAPAISRDLRVLERSGQLVRFADPADHRRTMVRLTPEGDAMCKKCGTALREFMHRALDKVEPETLRELLTVAKALEKALSDETAVQRGRASTAQTDDFTQRGNKSEC
jgi:DNA-binding MarR family transcriptional regulator